MSNRATKLTLLPGDLAAIALVGVMAVLVAIEFWHSIPGEGEPVVSVYQEGELVRELPLDRDKTIRVDGEYSNLVQIHGGKVAIVESDCPGADCVHSGWIHETGRTIICLPNRVEVRINGNSEVDVVVR